MKRTGLCLRFRGEMLGFLLCSLLGLISMAGFALQNHGFFYILSDFNTQQIPFTISLHQYLENSPVSGWLWNFELGHSAIQAYGFYALGSPFFWLSMLFPAGWFPYIISLIYVFKYGVAGFTACVFLKRFSRNRLHVLTGAVLYAFCGFQTVSIQYYHFHDVVALFPLLLIGLEILIREPRRYHLFVFAVFISCLTNYFFFVGEVLFVLLYFVFRFPKENRKAFFRTGGISLLCGLWGTAMAAILFVPSVLYILSHPRLNSELSGLRSLLPLPGWSLYVLKGLLFPGEGMYQQSSIMENNFESVSCWLPLVGTALCLPYLLKERNWLFRLLLLLLIASFIPLLSSAFSLFTRNYYRWWFMLALLMALASVRVLDEPSRYPVRLIAVLHAAAVLLLFGLLHVLQRFAAKDYIFHEDKLILYTVITVACYGSLLLFIRKKELMTRSLLIAVCAMAVCTTCLTLYFNRQYENGDMDRRRLAVGQALDTINDQYRYNLTSNPEMLAGGGSGMTIFSSTRSSGSMEFDALFDYDGDNTSMNKNSVAGLPELFGAKYCVTTSPGDAVPVRQFTVEDTVYYVIEKAACPIGYRVERYILKEDLLRLPAGQRGIALLQASVINPENEADVSGLAGKAVPEDLDLNASAAELAERNASEAVTGFSRDGSGFRCTSACEQDCLLWFSVPFDAGWTAWIDQQNSPVIDSGGMMLLAVPAGEHTIEFRYSTPGFCTGLWISVITITGYLLSFVVHVLLRRRKQSRPVPTI